MFSVWRNRHHPARHRASASLLIFLAFISPGDNSDTNGNTYTGSSRFFVVDARVLWKFAKQWSAALGVDNLNNATY